MLATVDALLPLSLLEAVRDVDTPEGVLEAEFVDELRNKRFGLSDTVYTQIKRYTEAVRRNQRHGAGRSDRAGAADRSPTRRRGGVARRWSLPRARGVHDGVAR